MDISFKPVGHVRTEATGDQIRREQRDLPGVLDIYHEFADALEGLDGFSHLFVLCYFDRLRPDQIGPMKVKPRRLVKKGFKLEELPWLGVFALDSPTRPNPIGLSLVQLIRREDCKLLVKGIDLFDRTPILDVKAYQADYRAEDYGYPDWYKSLMNEEGHI